MDLHTETSSSLRKRLARDEQGAIMVIAVFMAAVLVGVVWYMFGLGEAILYREHLRAAVDATAFDSAVVHALGMNIISMMNIVMAAVLSILVALMVVFIGGLLLTLITIALLFVPVVDAAAAAVLPELLDFDDGMFNLIRDVEPWIFDTLTVLNVSEGTVAIVMPFAGAIASTQVAGSYNGAVTSTWSFSPSMIPMRLPYFFNKWDVTLKDKISWKVPIIKQKPAPFKVASFQRYGLPVQDDTYGMLCMHAGNELVQEADLLIHLATFNLLPQLPGERAVVGKVGQWFGQVVGSVPWMFCSGLDPFVILSNLLNAREADTLNMALGKFGIFRTIKESTAIFKDFQKEHFSMFPMKPFDESKNGNGFMQVFGYAGGSATMTTGAVTGVAVAGWKEVEAAPNTAVESDDFAEAEFYFDCGGPATEGDVTVLGTTDTGGDWQDCKYNAMWNMRWKARLRRFHQFEWDLRKDIELSIYQGLGFDSFIRSLLGPLGEGSTAKEFLLDPIKACVTQIGGGSTAGSGDFGSCPAPIAAVIAGLGTLPNGGKIGFGDGTPDGYAMSQVLH